MRQILLIKIGALGDVLRTTPILRRLNGSVTWLTGRAALPLLADNRHIARLITVDEFPTIAHKRFDWVINFDEDERAGKIASSVIAEKKTGAQFSAGKFTYCKNSAPWFDMSLISRLSAAEADKRKSKSRKSYQHYLFKACGFEFNGEKYILAAHSHKIPRPVVAIERRCGPRWPLKNWPGYDRLITLFKKKGVAFFILRQRKDMRDYISDIARCSVLVSGDTLAMHIALALRKRAVAIFNCTSPWEIYGYGKLHKILHPKLFDLFYSKRAFPVDMERVKVETVFKAVTGAVPRAL